MARTSGALRAVMLGGLIAGTIDIGAACLISGKGPLIILRYVAGGLLGREALKGHSDVVAIGVGLQWAMSLIIAAVYVAASRAFPILARWWIPGGLAYGVVVFAVMNWVVVPLSALRAQPHFTERDLPSTSPPCCCSA
jgi:hypothetical protein